NAAHAISLENVISRAGFRTETVANAELALERLRRAGVDAVLTDIPMQGMNGFDLCRRIKDEAGTAHLPVLILTALSDPMDVVKGIRAGADYFLTEPFDAAELSRCLKMIGTRAANRGWSGELGELSLLGEKIPVNAGKRQIFTLLVSTFETFARKRKQDEATLAAASRVVTKSRTSANREAQRATALEAEVRRLHQEVDVGAAPVVGKLRNLFTWLRQDLANKNHAQIATYGEELVRAIATAGDMLEIIRQRMSALEATTVRRDSTDGPTPGPIRANTDTQVHHGETRPTFDSRPESGPVMTRPPSVSGNDPGTVATVRPVRRGEPLSAAIDMAERR
ncbi:MAG TPA: response regulator, partial [Planctomycetia bacterium]|nr:response regulator [Planctomycetia bacterium]